MDFKELAVRLRGHGDSVVTNANLLKRQVALAVDTAVVLATPVDTGRARSNWQVRVGEPTTTTIEPYVPGDRGSSQAANTQAAIDQAQEAVKGSQPEQTINITNNLSYIGKLNDGSSAQAPSGFVQSAVLTGIAAIKAAPGIVTGDFGNV